MDDLFSDEPTSGDKSDVMKSIRAAVEDGILAPAVMDEVMANVKPEDTKSQIMKKVRKAIEKRYVTPCVMEQVMSTIKPDDNKQGILKKIRRAVAKGQLPQSVMDEICEDMRSCDTKEDVMRIVYKAIEKKLVPQPVMYKILHPNEDGFAIMDKVCQAMKKKKMSPSVMDDIVAHVHPGEKKTEVMKKIRQAVEKGHLSPSTLEVIRDIDEAKQARDMNTVLDNLDKCRDKNAIMISLRCAVNKGQMPQTVMNDVIKSVRSKDCKDETIKKVQRAVRKRQLLPKITKVIKSKNAVNQSALICLTVSDMKIINEAVKAHEISPSVINIIKNEDNQIYFDTKKEFPLKKIMKKDKNIIICKDDIASYINVTSTEDEVIRRVRTAIKQGEISPSVIKMLLNKDNAGLIFSDEILCAIYPHGKNKTSVMRSKSLKTTKVSATSIVKCKHSQSERRTDYSSRKKRIRKRCSQTAPDIGKPNIMFDGMPKYTKQPRVFTIHKQGTTKKHLNPTNEGFHIVKDSSPIEPDIPIKPCASNSESITCKCSMERKKKTVKTKSSQPTIGKAKTIDCMCKMCQEESKRFLSAKEKTNKINLLKKQLKLLEQQKDKTCKPQKKIKNKKSVTEKCQTDRFKTKQKQVKTVTKPKKICPDNKKLRKIPTCQKPGSIKETATKICTNAITKLLKYTFNTLRDPDDFCEMIQDPCHSLTTFLSDRKAERRKCKKRWYNRNKKSKKRKKTIKKKHLRTALYFECNPYLHVESLQKKPKPPGLASCLFCPCIFLLRHRKQIRRILLYIFAFIVWCPCLFCFEIFQFMFYYHFGTQISGNRLNKINCD
ncbi:uncharacterized protein LOC118282282 [Spodoptera frugiperda]|uniref:Uncharacterized protein LOC118282282 n=1 Tax=Spodoptera frugiperda TaxID=7108 RepID=A0A9R0F0D5_SPOFR|nr:uncharacterized protein LOC118282282 [Spodoptera frugiperda]